MYVHSAACGLRPAVGERGLNVPSQHTPVTIEMHLNASAPAVGAAAATPAHITTAPPSTSTRRHGLLAPAEAGAKQVRARSILPDSPPLPPPPPPPPETGVRSPAGETALWVCRALARCPVPRNTAQTLRAHSTAPAPFAATRLHAAAGGVAIAECRHRRAPCVIARRGPRSQRGAVSMPASVSAAPPPPLALPRCSGIRDTQASPAKHRRPRTPGGTASA